MSMKPEEIAIGVTVVVVVIAVAAIICSCVQSRSSGCGSCSLEGSYARQLPDDISTKQLVEIAYRGRHISPARTHLDHSHYTTPSRLQAPSMAGGSGMSAPPRRTRFHNVQGVQVDFGGHSPHVRDHGDSLRNERNIHRRAHERRQGDGWGGASARHIQSMLEAPREGSLSPASPYNPSAPIPMVSESARDMANRMVGHGGQRLVPEGVLGAADGPKHHEEQKHN